MFNQPWAVQGLDEIFLAFLVQPSWSFVKNKIDYTSAQLLDNLFSWKINIWAVEDALEETSK